jgi:hypothetical protein
VTFTVVPHVGFANNTPLARYNDRLESRIRSWPVPSLAALPGTWLGNLDASYVFPDQPENGSLSALADAYLYLGPRDLLLGEPAPSATLLDKRYMAELSAKSRHRRRSMASRERPSRRRRAKRLLLHEGGAGKPVRS